VNTPITDLKLVANSYLACSCLETFFLFDGQGNKLVEVQLKVHITSLRPIPFPFNLFNFGLTTTAGELIRLGVESYGHTLGS
jgi:hypothetical protein